jgi:hypothetical protein
MITTKKIYKYILLAKIMNLIDKTSTTKIESLRDNNPKSIILHSTKNYSRFEALYNLHVNKNKWHGIGYHAFIGADNKVYLTRPLDKEGAHAWGFNFDSIGICIYDGTQGKLKKRLEIGRELVDYLRSELGDLSLISHTLAQIRYINKFFEQKGMPKIEESEDFMQRENFAELQKRFHDLAGNMPTEGNEKLKPTIKQFKNCPGSKFYDFVKNSNGVFIKREGEI